MTDLQTGHFILIMPSTVSGSASSSLLFLQHGQATCTSCLSFCHPRVPKMASTGTAKICVIFKITRAPACGGTRDTPCALKRAVNTGAVICLIMLSVHMEMSQSSVHSESLCLQPELVSSAPGLSLAAFQPPIIYVSGIFRVIPVSGVFMEIIQTGIAGFFLIPGLALREGKKFLKACHNRSPRFPMLTLKHRSLSVLLPEGGIPISPAFSTIDSASFAINPMQTASLT